LNLYLSCLKRFDGGLGGLSGLSLAVGVIVMRALDALGVTGAGLKWPNDVLAESGKLAGILVELSGEYQGPCAAVIGIGLNLRLTDALRAQAGQPVADLTGLCDGQPPARNRVAGALVQALADGLGEFERQGFAAFLDDYARHDLLHGQSLTLTGAHGELRGTGAGVDARGALQLRLADGQLQAIDSAEVTVRRA
jgi:BirA family biotin operon repressor/biotin-[acetyl-CoA-carboxylase] ligase